MNEVKETIRQLIAKIEELRLVVKDREEQIDDLKLIIEIANNKVKKDNKLIVKSAEKQLEEMINELETVNKNT